MSLTPHNLPLDEPLHQLLIIIPGANTLHSTYAKCECDECAQCSICIPTQRCSLPIGMTLAEHGKADSKAYALPSGQRRPKDGSSPLRYVLRSGWPLSLAPLSLSLSPACAETCGHLRGVSCVKVPCVSETTSALLYTQHLFTAAGEVYFRIKSPCVRLTNFEYLFDTKNTVAQCVSLFGLIYAHHMLRTLTHAHEIG